MRVLRLMQLTCFNEGIEVDITHLCLMRVLRLMQLTCFNEGIEVDATHLF